MIATATSTGALSLYELELTQFPIRLVHVNSTQYFTKDTLILALAFHPRSPDLLGVSLSSGEIALCQIWTPAKEGSIIWTLPAHSLEAWTVAFTEVGIDESMKESFYSGGDDSVLCTHAISSSGLIRDVEQIETKRNKRAHGAGVTAIVALPQSSIILTGSYDDHVRVFDPESSKVLAEANVGGGVWRLKVLDSYMKAKSYENGTSFRILASCMHSGTRILMVSCTNKNWTIKILAKFTEHGSMNYGSDAQPPQREFVPGHGPVTFVSTSFYDRLLCVWSCSEG